jgi:hypothetical protein
VILAAQKVLDGTARLQLQAANLADDFTRQHDQAFGDGWWLRP